MRILVIEDEAGIVAFLRQGLAEEGFRVEVATDGTTGMQRALHQPYDLLLIDWMLPGMSGIDICQTYRKEKRLTPIIFLTAKDTVQDTIQGLKAGANDYIKKPFSFEELLARIWVQLRPERIVSAELILGPVTLNTQTYQVFKHSREIELTRKEFNLLKFLMAHKNKVCERSEIIEQVWDIHFEYNTGVIDVYINALRKKLCFTKDEEYIQTVRGVGYIAREL